MLFLFYLVILITRYKKKEKLKRSEDLKNFSKEVTPKRSEDLKNFSKDAMSNRREDVKNFIREVKPKELSPVYKITPKIKKDLNYEEYIKNGYIPIGKKSNFVLLKDATQFESNVFKSNTEYVLFDEDKLLWEKTFTRPTSQSISEKGLVSIAWERTNKNVVSSTVLHSPCLTIINIRGEEICDFELPISPYLMVLSDDFVVMKLPYPLNSIRCYDLKSNLIRWNENLKNLKNIVIQIDSNLVYVKDSSKDSIIFTANIDGVISKNI